MSDTFKKQSDFIVKEHVFPPPRTVSVETQAVLMQRMPAGEFELPSIENKDAWRAYINESNYWLTELMKEGTKMHQQILSLTSLMDLQYTKSFQAKLPKVWRTVRSWRVLKCVGVILTMVIFGVVTGCDAKQSDLEKVSLRTPMQPLSNLAVVCSASLIQSVVDGIVGGIEIKSITNGPRYVEGAKYFPASPDLPEFCQVTGSFVTNPDSGKTANFLATLPAHWNGKYLQMGCSGHCGQFAVSDVAMSFATVTNQGYPHDPIKRGYAVFATDEGHEGMSAGAWAIKGDGNVDQEAIDDLLQRATRLLATIGKEFTKAFYSRASATEQDIAFSYFSGCSGGGRDALVAASNYPEAFDGIIAGSPYNGVGASFQMVALTLATLRSHEAYLSPTLIAEVDSYVKANCDANDGIKDGLIQNPAACDFLPERDLPRCEDDVAGDHCFTQAQLETLSVALNAIIDEHGNIVQPGFAISEVSPSTFMTPELPNDLAARDPFPGNDTGAMGGGYWALGDAMLKVLVHKNDPEFFSRDVVSFQRTEGANLAGYHAVVPQAESRFALKQVAKGIGHNPEGYAKLINADRKMLIWHNLSDQTLTPYMSINLYKNMAKLYGGYDKLQKNIRLFTLPGTGHCSMMGVGPNTFDALGAMEKWVEQGIAPNGLEAEQFTTNAMGLKQFDIPPVRTMPLCKFPEMARYKGQGELNVAASWECPEGDERMLQVGESGRQAGVVQ